ncbi:MAG: hypothetical protein DLM52_03280 [Chthoniobacterales bacterium]|nr:MAG: hypothetical protein DLM52_03280 [Chthoniobacterales bacterium]
MLLLFLFLRLLLWLWLLLFRVLLLRVLLLLLAYPSRLCSFTTRSVRTRAGTSCALVIRRGRTLHLFAAAFLQFAALTLTSAALRIVAWTTRVHIRIFRFQLVSFTRGTGSGSGRGHVRLVPVYLVAFAGLLFSSGTGGRLVRSGLGALNPFNTILVLSAFADLLLCVCVLIPARARRCWR